MNLEITIDGYSFPWQLLGTKRATHWLAKQPWLNFHEPVLLQVPSKHEDQVLDLLHGEVRRIDGGDVHVVSLRPTESARTTFSKWLDLGELSTRKLAESLVDCARRCPRLFVIGPVADAANWTDDLRVLLDTAQKLPDAMPFGIILTATGPTPTQSSIPCDVGWPTIYHLERDEHVAWAAYLHERIAWHVAGKIERVAALSVHIKTIRLGEDRDLEAALGRDADEALAMLDKTVRNDLLTSVRGLSGHRNLAIPQGLSGQTSVVLRPVPWLARALLRANPNHPERRYLASLTVCRPLADRLLGRCLDLEQRCRDHLLACEHIGEPNEAASRYYEKYKAKQSDEHIYAPGELLEIRSAWEFMDFAGLIDALQLKKSDRDNMHELRRIRNFLAHGKAIGWKAVTAVDRLERMLSYSAR